MNFDGCDSKKYIYIIFEILQKDFNPVVNKDKNIPSLKKLVKHKKK